MSIAFATVEKLMLLCVEGFMRRRVEFSLKEGAFLSFLLSLHLLVIIPAFLFPFYFIKGGKVCKERFYVYICNVQRGMY